MKDKKTGREPRVCPICGTAYTEVPALSREDNATLICPDCGIRQSLAGIGVSADEAERIITIIRNNSRSN